MFLPVDERYFSFHLLTMASEKQLISFKVLKILRPQQTGKVDFSAKFWWFSLVEKYTLKGKRVMLYQLLLFSTKLIICAPCIMAHPHVSIHVLSNCKCAKKKIIGNFRRGSSFIKEILAVNSLFK